VQRDPRCAAPGGGSGGDDGGGGGGDCAVRANVMWHPLLRAIRQPAPRRAGSTRKPLSLRHVVRDVIQGRPWTRVEERAAVDAGVAQAQERKHDRSTVLITGGLGAIGLEAAAWIARRNPGVRLCLSGRTGRAAETQDAIRRLCGAEARDGGAVVNMQRCDAAVAEECGASAADMRWRGGGGTFLGKGAQLDPVQPMSTSPGTKRLVLTHDRLLSRFEFDLYLRRYRWAARRG